MDVENQENNPDLPIKLQDLSKKSANVNDKPNNEESKVPLNDITNKDDNVGNAIHVEGEDSNSNDRWKKASKNTIDNDSEDDKKDDVSVKSKLKKRVTIIDSDSEDMPTPHNKSFNENLYREAPIYIHSKNGQVIPENDQANNLKRLSKLCDSESSAEEDREKECEDDESMRVVSTERSKPKKAKEKIEKPKKMNTKEALQQRREIWSESQRMTREIKVFLPYHRPKLRTFKEFLERRPKFASAVPDETTHARPALALKMSTQQLEIISKNLSEREKQVEEYFKSKSESEDEAEGKADEQIDEGEVNKQINEEQNLVEETKVLDNNQIDVGNHQSIKTNSNVGVNAKNTDENIIIPMDTNENEASVEAPTEVDDEANFKEITGDKKTRTGSSVIILANMLVQAPNDSHDNRRERNLGQSEDFICETDCLIPEETHIEELIAKYNNNEEESETVKIVPEKKNVAEILKEKLGEFKPKLSRTDDFINLDDNVNEFKQRYIKNTMKKQPHKQNLYLDILNVQNGEVHKEAIEIANEDDTIPIMNNPGERLKKFREELEKKIAEERWKFWQEKTFGKQERSIDEAAKGKSLDSDDQDIFDKADEDEFTEIEDDEDGDEIIGEDNDDNLEIDDEESKETFSEENVFLDNEAEESECDGDDVAEVYEDFLNEDVGEAIEIDTDKVDDEKNVDADDEDEESSTNLKKKKKLRRIIQVFENDSDDEDTNTVIEKNGSSINNGLALDTTDTLDDLSAPTPHQKRCDHTPIKPNMTQTKSELGFLTPVIQLTGLQSLNSGSKFLHDSPVSPFTMPKTSPSRMSQSGPQKKLFADDNTSDSQMLDDLADICSGKFATQTQRLESKQSEGENSNCDQGSNTVKENNEVATSSEIYDEPMSTTQDFLEICSGKFTGITQHKVDKGELQISNVRKEVEDIKQTETEKGVKRIANYTAIKTSNDEIKYFNDKDEEKLISQLLDEDELERFKKRFESPVKAVGRKILDSDEENYVSVQKKKVRNYISEQDDDDEREGVLEEIESEGYGDREADEPQEVEYDSEENEVYVTEQPKKLKMTDFVEDEAELSESDWGSADEDEEDMDLLEFEEGDNEKLDEAKIKQDLERIRMKRILDNDNYEVKMLQELLLDGGELHGRGRKRQFKWKNMDDADTNDENISQTDDGEVYLDDENENEEQWRKMRFEREKFLKTQQETSQRFEEANTEIESSSQIFKLGQAAMKRSLSNTPKNPVKNKSDSPDIKTSFTLVNKKGSFLSRSEQVLARVAELTSKAVNPTIGGAKNSRNFVFHAVQHTQKNEEVELKNVRKRKAGNGTPAAIKKLRLNTISPAVKKQVKSDKVRQLFTNW